MSTLAIIPARGGSKRFPRKNIVPLCGKPLIYYAIEAAYKSGIFDCIAISSEDDEIMELSRHIVGDTWPNFYFHKRSPELSTDTTRVWQVCLDVITELESKGQNYDTFAVLLPTSPLRTVEDIQAAYEVFAESRALVLMSVTEYEHPPTHALMYDSGLILPYDERLIKMQSQVLEPLYYHNGAIIIIKTEAFKQRKEFYGDKVVPYFMPRERAIDVNTEFDLKLCEFLLRGNHET